MRYNSCDKTHSHVPPVILVCILDYGVLVCVTWLVRVCVWHDSIIRDVFVHVELWHNSWTRGTHSAWLLYVCMFTSTRGSSAWCFVMWHESCHTWSSLTQESHVTHEDSRLSTVCECVSVWACECVGVRVWASCDTRTLVCQGCVSVWACEHVSVWVCGCVHHVTQVHSCVEVLDISCVLHTSCVEVLWHTRDFLKVLHTWGASDIRCITWPASLAHYSTHTGDPTSNYDDCQNFNKFSREYPYLSNTFSREFPRFSRK